MLKGWFLSIVKCPFLSPLHLYYTTTCSICQQANCKQFVNWLCSVHLWRSAHLSDCAIHSIFALLDLYSGGCLTRTWLFSYCTLRRVGYLHRLVRNYVLLLGTVGSWSPSPLTLVPYIHIIPHFKWFCQGVFQKFLKNFRKLPQTVFVND